MSHITNDLTKTGPSSWISTPLGECALRLGLSESQIERIISAAARAGIDVKGDIGEKFNAQHLSSCKLGFTPEDVLSDWFSSMHRTAAEESGVSIDALRGATELEAYGLYHGLTREEMNGLTEKEIYAEADKKDVIKLKEYALKNGFTDSQMTRINTTEEFHAFINNKAGVTLKDQFDAMDKRSFEIGQLNGINRTDHIMSKMRKAGLGDFNPPVFYRRIISY